MSNNTKQEITLILQTIVGPNLPNSDVNNYFLPTTMAPTAPTSNPDRIMQAVTEAILYSRNPAAFGYNVVLTAPSGTLKDLYEDIDDQILALKTAIDTVYTAIHAANVALS